MEALLDVLQGYHRGNDRVPLGALTVRTLVMEANQTSMDRRIGNRQRRHQCVINLLQLEIEFLG